MSFISYSEWENIEKAQMNFFRIQTAADQTVSIPILRKYYSKKCGRLSSKTIYIYIYIGRFRSNRKFIFCQFAFREMFNSTSFEFYRNLVIYGCDTYWQQLASVER